MNTQQNTQGQEASFQGLGIAPGLLDIIARLKYEKPTPIQYKAIPLAIEGKDLIGIAQTGTGKTLAYGIPMVQRLAELGGMGLVVVPTRELAIQVDQEFQKIGRSVNLRTAVLIGGMSMGPQLQAIRRSPNVIVATPGRLIDHLEQKTVRLDTVGLLVLDEADRMLDMGFLPQVKRIIAAVPAKRQTMLFSATLSPEIMRIAATTMKLPISIEIAPQGTTAEKVTQEIIMVRRKDEKAHALSRILAEYRGSVIVFTRMKFGAKRVTHSLRAQGYSAAEIHSNRSLNQRREALEGFKSGKYRVLVATDIAARGIDVKGIELVVNFDLPSTSSDYVHRIGRTGRAGAVGHAISLALPEERNEIRSIERLIRQNLKVTEAAPPPPGTVLPSAMGGERGPRRFHGAGRPDHHRRGSHPMRRGRGRFRPRSTSTGGQGSSQRN